MDIAADHEPITAETVRPSSATISAGIIDGSIPTKPAAP